MTTSNIIYYHLFNIPKDGSNSWNYFTTIANDMKFTLRHQQYVEYGLGLPCCIEIAIQTIHNPKA